MVNNSHVDILRPIIDKIKSSVRPEEIEEKKLLLSNPIELFQKWLIYNLRHYP